MLAVRKLLSKAEWVILTVSLCAYGLNKYWLCGKVDSMFMRCYFNDVLGGVVFGIILRANSRFWFKKMLHISVYIILIAAASFYWEWIAPLYIQRSVQDILDVAAYMGGGIALWLCTEKLSKEKTEGNDSRRR